jgi:arylformamidase
MSAESTDSATGYTQTELDRQYSPSSCVESLQEYLDAYVEGSRRARELPSFREVRYGPDPAEVIHLFGAPGPQTPVLVFVHGGFWQELSVAEASFAAVSAAGQGIAFAALGYGLAPEHDLDTIVGMIDRGLQDLTNGAPVYVSGHSAGAQLVAMTVLADTPPARSLARRITGVILLSGVYDLEPIRHSYVNRLLRLNRAAAHRNSPAHRLAPAQDRAPAVILARGVNETDEFARQQTLFAARLAQSGWRPTVLSVEGRNHFDLPFDLVQPGTILGDAVLTQISLT